MTWLTRYKGPGDSDAHVSPAQPVTDDKFLEEPKAIVEGMGGGDREKDFLE